MNNEYQFDLSFIAVGPQRTGSTWLHKVMEEHPHVGLPVGIKETMFFDRYYHKGVDWLLSHYKMSDKKSQYGEVAPTYFSSDVVLRRIKSEYPDCKILINIRNPVEHAYSMYLHESSKGRIQGKLCDVIKDSPEELRPGMYSDWIPRWQDTFGTENVCLVWMDQIKSKPQNVYQEVCTFLGLSANHYSQNVGDRQVNSAKKPRFPKLTRIGVSIYHLLREYRLHAVINFCKRIHLDKITFSTGKGEGKSILSHTDFEKLLKLYISDIEFLEQTTGHDLSIWRNYNPQDNNIRNSSAACA